MEEKIIKDTAAEVAKCAALRISKKVEISEDEYEEIQKVIRAEIMIGFAGEIFVK